MSRFLKSMTKSNLEPQPINYVISVKTGLRFGGCTNGKVYITLYGKTKKENDVLDCRRNDCNAFTRGDLHTFMYKSVVNISDKPRIGLRRDDGWFSCWYIDWIEIKKGEPEEIFLFPVKKWIKNNCNYYVNHLDTCLPQHDEYKKLRKEVLGEIQKEYQLQVKESGLPPQVKVLPDDEKFSCLEKVNLVFDKVIYEFEKEEILRDCKGNTSLSGCEHTWKSFNDVKSIYTKVFGKPQASEYRNNDASFGRQRLNGLNPSLLERCSTREDIPENFDLDENEINKILENKNIQTAMTEKKLFIINLEILSHCTPQSGRVMTCPLALFYFNDTEDLMPIAIQLFQKKADTNPVFYPTDKPYTWMLAKMWYSLADATYHQALTHLNFTHLMMEGISVVSKRQLASTHPIMKLLNPHFLYLMAIDSLALSTLINSGGFIDKTSNAGIHGHFDIMRKSMDWWRLDTHGNLLGNLKMRKVDDESVLKNAYHFRDDAKLLYKTIEDYVNAYVQLYYGGDNNSLSDDYELQAWGKELLLSRDDGGLGMKGVPNDGKFQNTSHLVQTLTPIIYTCSVGHAAANFQQYNEYADPFNYPYALFGDPPKDKKTIVTEKHILNTIAGKTQLLELMSITKILSEKSTNSLGDFEENLIVDPKAKDIVQKFQKTLLNAGEEIDKRNGGRKHPYVWLHPKAIPNAISI